VLLSVSKTMGDGLDAIFFEFECDGVPCVSRQITLTHLNFDTSVMFTDMTTVTYQGTVSIAGTRQFNPAGNPCPIADAKVCAFNHFGTNELIVCRTTDTNGMWLCCFSFFFLSSSFLLSLTSLVHLCLVY
jgi:hypothetical protein